MSKSIISLIVYEDPKRIFIGKPYRTNIQSGKCCLKEGCIIYNKKLVKEEIIKEYKRNLEEGKTREIYFNLKKIIRPPYTIRTE